MGPIPLTGDLMRKGKFKFKYMRRRMPWRHSGKNILLRWIQDWDDIARSQEISKIAGNHQKLGKGQKCSSLDH
jgi:hypothetical protein